MVSIFTESFCNNIKMEGNLSLSSNLKKTVQSYLDKKIINYVKTKIIDFNYLFEEVETDLLCSLLNSDYNITLLENRGYNVTTEESYTTEFFNNVYSYNKISSIEKTNIKEKIKVTCEDREKELRYFTNSSIVCMYGEGETKTEYFFKFLKYNILDFKIDNDEFIYMILEKNNKNYLAISHICLDFVELNSLESELKTESLLSFIPIEASGKLEKISLNRIVLSNQNGLTEITLNKKYYFSKENKIYFNYNEVLEPFKNKFINSDIQINHLNMYNYLNFLGLNDFKIDGKRKISSFEIELFKNIFKNKFDNTLNGGLNYFNSKIYNVSEKKETVDYKICSEDEYFTINGNFNYRFESGKFIIEIEEYKSKLFKIVDEKKLFIKEIIIPPHSYSFYFCNLKFNFKKFELPLKKLTYSFDIKSPYTFRIEKNENYPIEKLYNDEKANSKKMKKINTKRSNMLNNTYFNGKSLVFENAFDFENQKFLYGNLTTNLKRNEYLDASKYKLFFIKNSCYKTMDKIFFKEDAIVQTSFKKYVKLDLITENDLITDFWFENQGKKIFLKNSYDNVIVTTDINKADYAVKIPYIKDFVKKLEKKSEILDSNEDIVKIKKEEGLMVTDKFFNVPLYNKAFLYGVKDVNSLRLFNSDGIEEFEYISELKNNILEIYFNENKTKKYYCEYDEEKYIYLNVEKAQDDFKISIELEENGEKKITRTTINKFSLSYNKVLKSNESINLFIYDIEKKSSVKINFNNTDLDKEIELNVSCDYIIAEANFDIDFSKLSLNISNLKSFTDNDYLYFIKNYHSDILYITKEKEEFEESFLRKKMEIFKEYDIVNKNLVKNKDGVFLLEKPQKNSIYIENLSKASISIKDTILFSINKDEFFNKNFKTPGLIILNNDISKDTKIEKTSSNLIIGGENELL